MPPEPDDGPETDGCEIDFAEHADDDETAELRPLFPDGDPAKAEEWQALADAGTLTQADLEAEEGVELPNRPHG